MGGCQEPHQKVKLEQRSERISRGAMVILEGKETRKFKGESSRPAPGLTCPLRETKRERVGRMGAGLTPASAFTENW